MIIAIACLSAIFVAELAGILVGVYPSLVCHGLIVISLLNVYILKAQAPYRRILPVLALGSLLRILSFAMPLQQVPQIYWYAMIGIPFLIALGLSARLLNQSWGQLGLRLDSWSPQLLIALSGLPLSMIGYFVLRPRPIVANPTWPDFIVGIVILGIFVGLTEEIFFRGLLLHIANEVLGRFGLLFSSVLFAVMYIGTLSWGYVLFIGLIGLFFCWCVNHTGSVWGTAIAHSAISIGMILIWPTVLR